MLKDFSIKECLVIGWLRFKENAWFLMSLTFVMYLSAFFFAFLTEEFYYGIEPTRSIIDTVSTLFLYWISFGLSVIAFKIIDRRPYSWQDLFLIDIQLLWYLVGIILFSFLLVIGLLFLVIPGIYFMVRYGFFWAAIIDGHKNAFEAFHESSVLTRGVKWNIILFYMVATGVVLLGFLCLGVGVLAAIPIVLLANVHLYRVLLQQSLPELQEAPVARTDTSRRNEETLSGVAGEAPTPQAAEIAEPSKL